MTNEQLEEAVASLNELHATANITEMYLIIRQLWEEREQKRAVMARAKPVEVWELANTIEEYTQFITPQGIAIAILSRYNVTKKEEA